MNFPNEGCNICLYRRSWGGLLSNSQEKGPSKKILDSIHEIKYAPSPLDLALLRPDSPEW